MKIGFTGTKEGMSWAQRHGLREVLSFLAPRQITDAHHGLCKGADAEFHETVRTLFGQAVRIVGHPPINPKNRVWLRCDELWDEKDYGVRDKDIVKQSDVMIAAPFMPEYLRSGTWMTVRYARKQNCKIFILQRDGSISIENM